jgi:hypothetical protein
MVAYTCHSSYTGSINRSTVVPAGLDIKQDPIPKISKAKTAGNVAQVVEHLPRKGEAMNSNYSTPKKPKKPTVSSPPSPSISSAHLPFCLLS